MCQCSAFFRLCILLVSFFTEVPSDCFASSSDCWVVGAILDHAHSGSVLTSDIPPMSTDSTQHPDFEDVGSPGHISAVEEGTEDRANKHETDGHLLGLQQAATVRESN